MSPWMNEGMEPLNLARVLAKNEADAATLEHMQRMGLVEDLATAAKTIESRKHGSIYAAYSLMMLKKVCNLTGLARCLLICVGAHLCGCRSATSVERLSRPPLDTAFALI